MRSARIQQVIGLMTLVSVAGLSACSSQAALTAGADPVPAPTVVVSDAPKSTNSSISERIASINASRQAGETVGQVVAPEVPLKGAGRTLL